RDIWVDFEELDGGEVLVRLLKHGVFRAGRSEIELPNATKILERIGEKIKISGRKVKIEGHADFEDAEYCGTHADFCSSAWIVSASRAATIANYWVTHLSFDPAKIEVNSFGQHHPLPPSEGEVQPNQKRIELRIVKIQEKHS